MYKKHSFYFVNTIYNKHVIATDQEFWRWNMAKEGEIYGIII